MQGPFVLVPDDRTDGQCEWQAGRIPRLETDVPYAPEHIPLRSRLNPKSWARFLDLHLRITIAVLAFKRSTAQRFVSLSRQE